MKINVCEDEEYPVYDFSVNPDGVSDLEEDTVKWMESVFEQYQKAQSILRDLYRKFEIRQEKQDLIGELDYVRKKIEEQLERLDKEDA
jgi:hypothetical protein